MADWSTRSTGSRRRQPLDPLVSACTHERHVTSVPSVIDGRGTTKTHDERQEWVEGKSEAFAVCVVEHDQIEILRLAKVVASVRLAANDQRSQLIGSKRPSFHWRLPIWYPMNDRMAVDDPRVGARIGDDGHLVAESADRICKCVGMRTYAATPSSGERRVVAAHETHSQPPFDVGRHFARMRGPSSAAVGPSRQHPLRW